MVKSRFIKYLENNEFPISIVDEEDELTQHIKLMNELILSGNMSIEYKQINIPIVEWNISNLLYNKLFSIVIVDGIIVGKVECEIMTQIEIEEELPYGNEIFSKEILSKNAALYISHVDIKNSHQGFGLCKPLLSYTIKNLKKLGYDMLFIENASMTKDGVPACVCYYKAGIENKYNMRYYNGEGTSSTNRFKKMVLNDCLQTEKPSTYFYIVDKIAKSGFEKFKKIQKVLKFLSVKKKAEQENE